MRMFENMYEKLVISFFFHDPHFAADVTQTSSGLKGRSLKTNWNIK
jgi:hypothetical protein